MFLSFLHLFYWVTFIYVLQSRLYSVDYVFLIFCHLGGWDKWVDQASKKWSQVLSESLFPLFPQYLILAVHFILSFKKSGPFILFKSQPSIPITLKAATSPWADKHFWRENGRKQGRTGELLFYNNTCFFFFWMKSFPLFDKKKLLFISLSFLPLPFYFAGM